MKSLKFGKQKIIGSHVGAIHKSFQDHNVPYLGYIVRGSHQGCKQKFMAAKSALYTSLFKTIMSCTWATCEGKSPGVTAPQSSREWTW